MVLCIESNMELHNTGLVFFNGPIKRLEDNYSLSSSPKEREKLPSHGDHECDSEAKRQE
jgi:hypothetical protein